MQPVPLIPVLKKQRQLDMYEFEASLAYKVNSRTKTPKRNPVLKTPTKKPTKHQNKQKPNQIKKIYQVCFSLKLSKTKFSVFPHDIINNKGDSKAEYMLP